MIIYPFEDWIFFLEDEIIDLFWIIWNKSFMVTFDLRIIFDLEDQFEGPFSVLRSI